MKFQMGIVVAAAILAFANSNLVKAAPTHTVIGGANCNQVLKFCARSEIECLAITSWSAGFISGLNWTKMTEDLSEILKLKLPKSNMDVSIPFQTVKNDLIKKCQAETKSSQVEATIDLILDYYRDQQ